MEMGYEFRIKDTQKNFGVFLIMHYQNTKIPDYDPKFFKDFVLLLALKMKIFAVAAEVISVDSCLSPRRWRRTKFPFKPLY